MLCNALAMKVVGEATLLPMAALLSGALLHSLVPDVSKAPPAPGGRWQCCAGDTNPCPPLPWGRWVASGFHGRGWRRNGGKCVEMAPSGNSCILGASCLLQAPLGGSLGRVLLVSKELLGAFSRDDIRVLGAWQYLRECPVTCGPPASLRVSPRLVTCCFALFWPLAALSGLGVLQVQLGGQGENFKKLQKTPSPPKAAVRDTVLWLALHMARTGAGGISGSMSTPSPSPAVEAS